MALTEEFKNKYKRIASEEGYFGEFDWDKIEKQLEARKKAASDEASKGTTKE